MDLGTGIVTATSVLAAGGLVWKTIAIKNDNRQSNKFVRKDVYAAESHALKEIMEKGFKEIGRRLTLIEGKM